MAPPLSWSGYLDAVLGLAGDAGAPGWDVEAHLAALAALGARLDRADPALVARFQALERSASEDYLTDEVLSSDGCRVMLVRLRAGGRVGLHDHACESGFLLCCAGRVEVEAFDVAPGAPSRLRRCFSGAVEPGGSASLTARRGNVHSLDCPVETWLIDVFTPGPAAPCRPWALGEEVEAGLFAAQIEGEGAA